MYDCRCLALTEWYAPEILRFSRDQKPSIVLVWMLPITFSGVLDFSKIVPASG